MWITRRLEFDYGHRVLGHEGKCRHLHGHRGVAEICVSASKLDSIGRVVDFGVIKQVVGSWIDTNWDHNLLLNHEDPQLTHFFETEERQPFVMEGNPTAENMAKVLYAMCALLLPPELVIEMVRLWETPNSYAEYIGQ